MNAKSAGRAGRNGRGPSTTGPAPSMIAIVRGRTPGTVCPADVTEVNYENQSGTPIVGGSVGDCEY